MALAIGSHMRTPIERWGVDENMTVIRIDVDYDAMQRIQRPDLPIVARAEDALPPLIDRRRSEPQSQTRTHAMLRCRNSRRNGRRPALTLEPHNTYLKIMREELGEDGVFIDEYTQVGYAARYNYPVYHPRTFIASGYQGTLGFGFPTGLGVKVARPDVPVLSIAWRWRLHSCSPCRNWQLPCSTGFPW